MRRLLETARLGLAATAGFLACYWAWQELARCWSGRHERRARRRAARQSATE